MPDPLQVPWSNVREGNRVLRHGHARRVVIVTHAENDVAVLFDDGSREFHVGEEPTQLLLVQRSAASVSAPADKEA